MTIFHARGKSINYCLSTFNTKVKSFSRVQFKREGFSFPPLGVSSLKRDRCVRKLPVKSVSLPCQRVPSGRTERTIAPVPDTRDETSRKSENPMKSTPRNLCNSIRTFLSDSHIYITYTFCAICWGSLPRVNQSCLSLLGIFVTTGVTDNKCRNCYRGVAFVERRK